MGLAEELEELRKKGLTKQNADELKDAVGLSTPEDAENAIKAEQERTRPANYGKEAREFLKTSPTVTGNMTNPFDDDYEETEQASSEAPGAEVEKKAAGESSSSSSSSKKSKDITNLIQITNDFSVVGENNGLDDTGGEHEEESEENSMDCLFGSVAPPKFFCPIDTSAVRGALEEHVVPRVDGATESIRGALEEHVVPNVEKVRRQAMETVDDFHRRSVDTIGRAREHSIRTMDSASAETQRLLSGVQTTSQRGVDAVRQQSQNFLDRSKAAMDDVSATTRGFVVPKCQQVSGGCQTFWSALGAGIIAYVMGTAPGWKEFSSTWYWVLKEASLRAFGRVVFCDNPVTGLLIWLGMLYASPLVAVCSLLSVLTVNGTAIYFGMDKETIRSGNYARNAVLIGASLVNLFAFDFPLNGNQESEVSVLLFLSIALAPLTLILEFVWIQKAPNNIPSLLFPFNIVLLATVFCAKLWNVAMETQIIFQSPMDVIEIMQESDTLASFSSSEFFSFQAVLNGLSRVFFVDDGTMSAGLLILTGVLLCSRIVALSLLAGSALSTVVLGYWVFEENTLYLDYGYAGFNPALCAAGIFFYLVPSWRLTGLAILGVVATVIVQGAVDVVLGILGAPVSTSLGFCLTMLPLLSIGLPSFLGNGEDYFIRAVPKLELSTPEGYLNSMEDDFVNPSSSPTENTIDEDEDVEKNAGMEAEVEESPVNEETPLLSS